MSSRRHLENVSSRMRTSPGLSGEARNQGNGGKKITYLPTYLAIYASRALTFALPNAVFYSKNVCPFLPIGKYLPNKIIFLPRRQFHAANVPKYIKWYRVK